MDNSKRQKKIFEKVNALNQRRKVEALRGEYSEKIVDTLDASKAIFTPNSHELLCEFYPIDGSGFGKNQVSELDNYCFKEFGAFDDLINAVFQVDFKDRKSEVYFSFGSISEVLFQNERYFVPNHPLWVANGLEIWEHITILLNKNCRFLCFVETSLKFGIVIDHYMGQLEDSYNPDEIVYELAYWGSFQ